MPFMRLPTIYASTSIERVCLCTAALLPPQTAPVRRSFVSSSFQAADPSTAPTSAAGNLSSFAMLAAKLPKRMAQDGSKAGRLRRPGTKASRGQSLADALKAAREASQRLQPARKQAFVPLQSKDAVRDKSKARPQRRRYAARMARKAARAAAQAAAEEEARAEGVIMKGKGKQREAGVLSAMPLQSTVSSEAIGIDRELRGHEGVRRKLINLGPGMQPTSESGFPEPLELDGGQSAASSTSMFESSKSSFLDHNLRDKDALAMMEKMVETMIEKCLADETGETSKAEEQRLRQFLSKSLANYRVLKQKKKKELLKSDFLWKLEATSGALQADQDIDALLAASASAEEMFDAALGGDTAVESSEDVVSESSEAGHSASTVIDVADCEEEQQKATLHMQRRHHADVSAADIEIGELEPLEDIPVASLSYDLERILFNPGVHWLRDPRTNFYNYSKALQSIPDTKDFDFSRLPPFMKPSSDPNLRQLLAGSPQTFAGSTSSLTGALSQIYFTINGNKPLNTQSQSFIDSPRSFSPGARLPASIILNRTEEGKYIVDADKAMDSGPDNPLSEKGHILEKMLTYPPEEFRRFLKNSKNPLRPDESRDKKEAYHFATVSHSFGSSDFERL